MAVPEYPDKDLVVLKTAATAADRAQQFLHDVAADVVKAFARDAVGKETDNLQSLRQAVQKTPLEIESTIKSIMGAIGTIITLVPAFIQWECGYQQSRPAEYKAKKKHLIEIPEPGTLIAALIKDGYSCEAPANEGVYKHGLLMHGLAWPQRLALERGARTRLDPRSYWLYGRRIVKKADYDPIEKLRMAGLFAGDIDIFTEVQKELLPFPLVLQLIWRGLLAGEDIPARLMELGYKKEHCADLVAMSENVLPPDLAVRGLWREKWDKTEAVKRLYATGLRKDDIEQYLALSYSLLPLDLLVRGWWRGEWSYTETVKRITALGFDGAAASEMPELMHELMGQGDLTRLLYAQRMDESGYVAGLKRLGLDPDDADRLGSYPWQPIPASETMRLLWAGKLDPAAATAALRTTGLPPPVADKIVDWPWRATSPEFAHRMFDRGVIDSAGVVKRLVAGGIDPKDAKRISLIFQDPLPIDALFQLYRRDIIDREEVVRGIGHQGYSRFDAEKFAELAWLVPSPQDVISFAVRDVFESDVVAHFGYADEFPPEFVKWAKKAGLTDEVALLYWYAHWYVPGVDEVMRMFHRIKPGQQEVPREQRETWVSDEDVDMYLKTKDVPPWWRPKVKAVAFHPISRVDIRRAYRAGLATEEDVYDTNRALGYSHRDSEILTEWTKSEYMEGEQALFEAKVRDGLMDGTLTREEAEELLKTTGMPPHRVRLLVDWAEYERERAKKDLTRSMVQKLYVEGYIDAADVRVRLAALRYGGEEVELLLGLWTVDRDYNATVTAGRKARPSRAQVLAFWKENVIDEREWDGEMEGLGYADHYIEWYKTHGLIKWSDDEIAASYLSGYMREETALSTLHGRGWTLEALYDLMERRRERV